MKFIIDNEMETLPIKIGMHRCLDHTIQIIFDGITVFRFCGDGIKACRLDDSDVYQLSSKGLRFYDNYMEILANRLIVID